MSRKSMLSNSICSRKGTSSFSCAKSSSGVMSLRISMISSRISAGVIPGNFQRKECWLRDVWALESLPLGSMPSNNDGRVDAQHAERVIENVADFADFARLVRYEAGQSAFRIEL